MNKSEPILTDAEMHALICGNPSTLGLSIARLKDFIRQVEKAAVTKLVAGREPVAWRITAKRFFGDFTKDKATAQWWQDAEPESVMPLYAHPMPCPSDVSDKTACISESIESENRDLQLLKQALETMISAAHPAYVQDDLLREKLIKARDIAFKALEANRLNAKEHHRTTKNLTVDSINITKLSLSIDAKEAQALLQSYLDDLKDWQLVPKEPNRDMLKKMFYEIFDMDGIEEEHLAARYRNMLSSFPKYTGDSSE